MSDIFKISLDSLLKGDENVLNHLDKTTNIIKKRNKYIKLIEIILFIAIWVICGVVLYLTRYSQIPLPNSDYTPIYDIIMLFIMPLSIIIFSTIIGYNWSNLKLYFPFLSGLMLGALCLFDYIIIPYVEKVMFTQFITHSLAPSILLGTIFSYVAISVGEMIKMDK